MGVHVSPQEEAILGVIAAMSVASEGIWKWGDN